jgi:hypothetical protein
MLTITEKAEIDEIFALAEKLEPKDRPQATLVLQTLVLRGQMDVAQQTEKQPA